MSEETRKKISELKKGKRHPPEVLARISESNRLRRLEKQREGGL